MSLRICENIREDQLIGRRKHYADYFYVLRHHNPLVFDGYKQHNQPMSMPNMPSLRLIDGEILSGELPRKQLRLVQAWIELHRDELMADGELAVSGENPYKIAPL